MTAVGTIGYDLARSVVVQSDGRILVVGNSEGGTGVVRYNPDASLDTSFGNGGKVTTSGLASNETGNHVAIQADGKILVAGSVSDSFGLIRYNSNGSLDNSFGSGGTVTTNFAFAHVTGMTQQPDGKTLVVGYQTGGSNDSIFLLARYETNGSLDVSFGTGGIVTTAVYTTFGVTNDKARSISLQPDKKILVGGICGGSFCVVRYSADGSLDASFGSDGRVRGQSGNSYGVATQADGKILQAGFIAAIGQPGVNFSLSRYNVNGSLDTSFGIGGSVTTVFDGQNSTGYSVAVQTDGKILLSGGSCTDATACTNRSNLATVRYNTNGSVDTTFGIGGKATIPSGLAEGQTTVTLQADGKVLVAGTIANGTKSYFGLVRFNANGTPDASFNPRTSLDNAPTFTEGGPAVVLNPTVSIYDEELSASNFSGATVTLARRNGANVEDLFYPSGRLGALIEGAVLSLNGMIIGTVTQNSSGTLSILFNVNATQARVVETLSSFCYANSSRAPPSSVVIDWTFNDGNTGAQGTGGALTTTGSNTVAIVAVNDPPTGSNNTVKIAENKAYTIKVSDFGFSDAEDGSALTSLRIESLPSPGSLRYAGASMSAGLEISAGEIAGGVLTFTPAGTGGTNYAAFSFRVKDSSGAFAIDSNTLTFSLLPTAGATPTSLVFASQNQGTSSGSQTITLTNTGGGAVLNIASIVVNGDFARTTTCGATLAKVATCLISVTFTPTATGTRSGSIIVTSDASNSPATTSLTGTGVASPRFTLNATSLTFAVQNPGTTSTVQTVALNNIGGAVITISNIAATGDFAVTHTCGSSLAAGGSCSLSITFTPTVAGGRIGSVVITSNAAGNATIALGGTANAPPSAPTLSTIASGAGSATLTFTVPTNNGGTAIASYTGTCTANGETTRTASAFGSPLVVGGLNGDVVYLCSVTATNDGGLTSGPSAALSVTPSPAKRSDIPILLMLLLD